jgi:histidinol-phosphate aminotransferase
VIGEVLEPLGLYLGQKCGPGGEFIYSDPGYTALIESATAPGAKGVAVPLNLRLGNDLAAIAGQVHRRTQAIFLANPHNPTGIASDSGQLRRFVREQSRRTLVIIDEAYLDFADDPARRTLADLAARWFAGGRVSNFLRRRMGWPGLRSAMH